MTRQRVRHLVVIFMAVMLTIIGDVLIFVPIAATVVESDFVHPKVNATRIDEESKKPIIEVTFASKAIPAAGTRAGFFEQVNADMREFQQRTLHAPLTFGVFGSELAAIACLVFAMFLLDMEFDWVPILRNPIAYVGLLLIALLTGSFAFSAYRIGLGDFSVIEKAISQAVRRPEVAEEAIAAFYASLSGFGLAFPFLLIILMNALVAVAYDLLRATLEIRENVQRIGRGIVGTVLLAELKRTKDPLLGAFLEANVRRLSFGDTSGLRMRNVIETMGPFGGKGTGHVRILPSGLIEFTETEFRVRWKPLPAVECVSVSRKTIVPENFYECLIGDHRREITEEIEREITDIGTEEFGKSGQDAVRGFISAVVQKADIDFKTASAVMEADKLRTIAVETSSVLRKASRSVLLKFKEGLSRDGARVVSGLTADFRKRLVANTVEAFSKSTAFSRDKEVSGIPLLPQNTRLKLEVGNMKLFVIEQSPMTRGVMRNGECYSLSFPFVVFIVRLKNDVYDGMQVYYRNTPLESISDELFFVNMTNVDVNGDACLRFPGHRQQGALNRVYEVLNRFWSGEFNDHLFGAVELHYSGHSQNVGSWSAWEQQSLKDPMFALKVKWRKATTLQAALKRKAENIMKDIAENDIRIAEIIERSFADTEKDVMDGLKIMLSGIEVDEKYPDEVIAAVRAFEEKLISGTFESLRMTFDGIAGDDRLSAGVIEAFRAAIGDTMRKEIRPLVEGLLDQTRTDAKTLVGKLKTKR